MKIRTNIQIEGILRTAFCLDGNSIKDVAETTGINRNTLYKWNCAAIRFSPDNIDKLRLFQTFVFLDQRILELFHVLAFGAELEEHFTVPNPG